MSSALFPDMFNKCVGASKKEFVVHMLHVTRPHNIRPLQGKRDSKIMFETITVLLFLWTVFIEGIYGLSKVASLITRSTRLLKVMWFFKNDYI